MAKRFQALLSNQLIAAGLVEINGIKRLFHDEQGWKYSDALTFANAVVAHLGDA